MSKRVSKAAASVVASKYAHAIYDKSYNELREKLFVFAKELYEKYIPLGFRTALNTYKEFYCGDYAIPFKCGQRTLNVWFEKSPICPNLKRIEVSEDEFEDLKWKRTLNVWFEKSPICLNLKRIEVSEDEFEDLKWMKDEIIHITESRLAFERNATEIFCKLKTWDKVVKYDPEVADYIPKEVEVLETLGIEDLKKMAKAVREGVES